MTDLASLFRNSGDNDDDAFTIDATNANSHLGTLLLESDWDECLSYLQTLDGRRDVIDGIDPLGILHQRVVAITNNSKDGGAGEGTALFAALYVRAPYDIVQMIHDIQAAAATTQSVFFDDHIVIHYLVYVLYVVPSEEDSRLMHTPPATIRTTLQPSPSYRTRAWSIDEYENILHLLLRSISSSTLSLTSSHLLSCYQRTPCCGVASNNITKGDDRISSS